MVRAMVHPYSQSSVGKLRHRAARGPSPSARAGQWNVCPPSFSQKIPRAPSSHPSTPGRHRVSLQGRPHFWSWKPSKIQDAGTSGSGQAESGACRQAQTAGRSVHWVPGQLSTHQHTPPSQGQCCQGWAGSCHSPEPFCLVHGYQGCSPQPNVPTRLAGRAVVALL